MRALTDREANELRWMSLNLHANQWVDDDTLLEELRNGGLVTMSVVPAIDPEGAIVDACSWDISDRGLLALRVHDSFLRSQSEVRQ